MSIDDLAVRRENQSMRKVAERQYGGRKKDSRVDVDGVKMNFICIYTEIREMRYNIHAQVAYSS